MKEINFYCIEEDINLFLHSFLTKLVSNNKKILVYSENSEKMEKLDSMLWSIKKISFLPHLLNHEKNAENTPIVISNEKNNINNANFLLISSFLENEDFLDQFEKTFYIFSPINSNLIQESKKNWQKYKEMNFDVRLFRKNTSGKWSEYKEFEIDSI